MNVLLDECLPRRLKREMSDYQVATVPEKGWAGIKNGALLRLMQRASIDVFVTIDGNLEYQQNLKSVKLALVILQAPDNTFETLSPLVPQILAALQQIKPGDIIRIES